MIKFMHEKVISEYINNHKLFMADPFHQPRGLHDPTIKSVIKSIKFWSQDGGNKQT